MDAELADHLARLTDDLISAGHPPAEAARCARIAMGPTVVHKEGMRASVGLRWWDEARTDLRYALRLLRKSPGFAAIAAGSLAIAIGANSTIFAVGRQLLFGRVTVPHAEQLRLLRWVGDGNTAVSSMWGDFDSAPNHGVTSSVFSYPVYEQLRASNRELADLVAFKEDSMNVTAGGHAQRGVVEMVSANFYEQMGVPVQLGRPLQPSDEQSATLGSVAVISDGMWEHEFGRSLAVLGQTVRVNQAILTIIGVNPRGFTGVKGAQESPDLLVPITLQPLIDPKGKNSQLTNPGLWWVNIVARARPGIDEAAAQLTLASKLESAVRGTMVVKPGSSLPKLQLVDGSRGIHLADEAFEKPVYLLLALTGLLLLLACANVANLLLARGAHRQREINVRMAVGASRGRIVRQLFAESLLLSAFGGVGGLLISSVGSRLMPKLLVNSWERADLSVPVDWNVFGFTVLVAFLTAVLFGLTSAWLAAKGQVSGSLKDSALQVTRRRGAITGQSVVAFQIALSTVLVIGAGIFLRTVMQLSSVDVGFNPDHLLLFEIDLPELRYAGGKDVLLHQQLERSFAVLSGVQAVAPAQQALIANNLSNADFIPEGEPDDPKRRPAEDIDVVGNNFFATMRIPILAGRAFNSQETAKSPHVMVINQALARKRFPNVDPIGKHAKIDTGSGLERFEIVGICGDARYMNLRDAPPPQFYVPYVQLKRVGGMVYQIRTSTDAANLVPALRRIVQQDDPDLPMNDVRTQREQIAADMKMERSLAVLASGFGVVALILASVGIYGIMAFSVAQRTNEIGIRIALGALPQHVRHMVLRESFWLTGAGLAAGLAGALVLTRLARSLLYGVEPWDPLTMAGGVLVLTAVAIGATWIPASRAAAVQPMEALRHE